MQTNRIWTPSTNVLKASPRRRQGVKALREAKASPTPSKKRGRARGRSDWEMKGGARRLPELAGARPPPSSSSTAPVPARSGPQETGEVRGLEGGAAAVLHLSSWRGRRGSLLHGSATAAVDVQGSASGREERHAGRKGGAAALLRGRKRGAALLRGRSGGSFGRRVTGRMG